MPREAQASRLLGKDEVASSNLASSSKGAVKKHPAKNGGFQKWDPPLAFSVYFACGILFARKVNAPTTPPGNCGFPGDFFRYISGFLRRFLHCQLPQVVLVKVKTAGY